MKLFVGRLRTAAQMTTCAAALFANAAHAQKAAEPAQTPAELPPLEVTAKKAQKTAPAKKAQAKAAPKAAPQPVQSASQDEDRSGLPSGVAPVKNYVAKDATTGTKTDTPLQETPQSISVVGAEQIRDQGARTIQEAIRYVPGVLADGFGYDSRGDYFYIRGVEGAHFLDGMRTPLGYNRIPLDPFTLERVEVLRGPASMLYGQSSSGGLVNGISKRPQEDAHREITVEYGSFDFKQVKTDMTGPLTEDDKWLYRIVGVARDAETQVDYVDNNNLMLAPSITYKPTNDTSITLLTSFQDYESGSTQQFLPHEGTLYPNATYGRVPRSQFLGEPGDYYETEAQSASLLIDHKFSKDLILHHGVRYGHTENAYESTYPAILGAGRIATINSALNGAILDTIFPGFGFPAPADVPFSVPNAPFLDAAHTQMARAQTVRYTTTEIVTSDTNLTGKFDTGPVSHTLTGGYDLMWYDTHGQTTPILINNLLQSDILSPGFNTLLTPYDALIQFFSGGAANAASVAQGLTQAFGGQKPFNIFNPQYGQNSPVFDFGNVTYANGIPMTPFGQEQIQNGIYLQDQLRFGPWIAVLGLRHDWLTIKSRGQQDEEETATTGRAALMYAFDFGLTPYVSYSESFTPIPGTPIVEDYTDTTFKAAKPMEGEQVEIGFKFAPRGTPFMLNVAAYELTESNRIVQPDILFEALQGASVRVRGVEVEAAGRVTENFKLIGTYAFTDAIYEKYHPLYAYNEGTAVEGIPRHQASLWGIYSFNDGFLNGLSLGLGVRYVGETTDVGQRLAAPTYSSTELFEVTTPSYTLVDGMIAYETDDWRWQLSAQNIEDKYHVVSCTADRGDCAIGQARTVITGFTYKF